MMDKSNTSCILHYSSTKANRVTRSSMAGETIAFTTGFDHAFLIKHDLQRLLGIHIPLYIFIDSKALFDVFTKFKHTCEHRLMIDIESAREAYKEYEIENIGLIKSEYNPADSLTKINGNGALMKLLITHKIDHPVEQYVIRTKSSFTQTSKEHV